jgi:hypothetical protein
VGGVQAAEHRQPVTVDQVVDHPPPLVIVRDLEQVESEVGDTRRVAAG